MWEADDRNKKLYHLLHDKETIQSLSRGLEKRERNDMVFKNSLERKGVWWNKGMISCMVLTVWMLGSAAALTREKGQLEREVGGKVPTDEGSLGSWEFLKGYSS